MFSQNFGDLHQSVNFGQFSLAGSHRPINSTVCDHLNANIKCEYHLITLFQYLRATQISVTNVLSSIHGSFNVTQSLCLESIRGYFQQHKTSFWFLTSSCSPISADIMLSPRSDQSQPTTLRLGTGNR